MPDFFLKFGLITSMVEDVASFQRQMKSSNTPLGWLRKKRFRSSDTENKYFLHKSKPEASKKPFKHSMGHVGLLRARADKSYMVRAAEGLLEHFCDNVVLYSCQPPCYGFNYMTAVDIMVEKNGQFVPDVEEMKEIMSEMSDMRLVDHLSKIFEYCNTKVVDGAAGMKLPSRKKRRGSA